MKTFKFIVINKNNMKELRHFSKASDVSAHLMGRKLGNIMVIVNERQTVHVGELGTVDVNQIERVLNQVSADLT